MRKLQNINLPETNYIADETSKEYAKALNIELDGFFRDLGNNVNSSTLNTQSEDYTVKAVDEVVLCSGTITITLPTVSSSINRSFTIKNTDSGTITVDGSGSETIDGSANQSLASQYDVITVFSDGSEWHITNRYIQ